MNKKFSTLVASLLLSSAFSVYAGNAKPMLATPTQVETRATSADVEEVQTVTTLPSATVNLLKGVVLPGFTNNARLFYAGDKTGAVSNLANYLRYNQGVPALDNYQTTAVKQFYWTLNDKKLTNNNGQDFQVKGFDEFEIIPVKTLNPSDPTCFFVLGVRDSKGQLSFVKYDGVSTKFDLTGISETIDDAAYFCSVETAYNTNVSVADLNAIEGDGFKLTVASKIEEDASVAGSDVFSGSLKAVETGSPNAWKLYNASAGKYIAFDTNEYLTSDPNALKGKFKLVDNPDAAGLLDRFCIASADNGSNEFVLEVNGYSTDSDAPNNGISVYRLYIANTNGTYALSIADFWAQIPAVNTIDVMDWAATSFGDGNLVDLRKFLTGEFYTIDFVEAVTPSNDNAYKKGGRLAVLDAGSGAVTDYVPAAGLYEKAPEAQWAVSASTGANGIYFADQITFTNRENPSQYFTINKLRSEGDSYVVKGFAYPTAAGIKIDDVVKITAVKDHKKNDGYAVFDSNDLRNKTWRLGQKRQTADGDINVYWAENHKGSHQIGATVEEEKASKWNLSLVRKNTEKADYQNQIDSVLVVSTLQKWNDVKSRVESKQDTLVILPYAFQNRSNAEFVKFNDGTNLNYYECRPYELNEAKEFAKGTWDATTSKIVEADARFALKMKADGTYNYVVLAPRVASDYATTNAAGDKANVVAIEGYNSYASKKVFQENSTVDGTWSQMSMYAKDANSLMFVEPVTAPEYRKLVSELGVDTVKIYRAENPSQVVYEKRDAKSVVEGRTLSFLNIDNDVQFGEINPALYVDTAYVNRGNNTRYQYLLGVNVTEHKGFYCPDHGFATERPCEHAEEVIYKSGRYLINMIDTANILAKDLKVSIHNNPYINETEEGNYCAKLSFVDAIHVLKEVSGKEGYADQLYVINNGDTTALDMSTPDFNVAKFAFKYVDSMNSEEFKIQTLWKDYNPDTYGTNAYAAPSEEGYLRWVNGCVVVDNGYAKGDVFDMNEDETRTPTANEEITAEGSVVVAGTNGAVVVKGAEGKSVIVSTILGKVVANEVLTSDNATIAAPAGVVVVSVDGESFKVVVK